MPRDKNPKIRPDAVGTYARIVRIEKGPKDYDVTVNYTACLVDSEDVAIIDATGPYGHDFRDEIQRRVDLADSPLRVELAEYADHVEAHPDLS